MLRFPSRSAPRRTSLIALITMMTVTGVPGAPAARAADPVLVGAGDLAGCDTGGDGATAQLVRGTPGTVVAVGALAHPHRAAPQIAPRFKPPPGAIQLPARPAPRHHQD